VLTFPLRNIRLGALGTDPKSKFSDRNAILNSKPCDELDSNVYQARSTLGLRHFGPSVGQGCDPGGGV